MSAAPHGAGILALCLVLVGLGAFVFARDPRASLNRRFALSMLTVSGWIGCISMYLSTRAYEPNLFLGRLAFAFASAIPFMLLWMFESFRESQSPSSAKTLAIPGLFTAVFAILSFTPLIVAASSSDQRGANFVYGPLHPFFGLYFIVSFGFSLYRLWIRLKSAVGIKKLQLRYLLLGILLGGSGAITTNLVIPLVWNTSRFSLLGPYFSLVLAMFAAHAIIRYRLMDIKVAIKRGVVYVCGIALTVSLFLCAITLLRIMAEGDSENISTTTAVAVAIVTAILFERMIRGLAKLVNRYFYREEYDYQRTIRDASRRLSTILDPNSLLEQLAAIIEDVLKVEVVLAYLSDYHQAAPPRLAHVSARWALGTSASPETLPPALLHFLEAERRLCVREEWSSAPKRSMGASAAAELQALGADLAIPILEEGKLSGVLVVGSKLSGDPYFPDDIDLLSTLINQAAIALKNAHLYRQVLFANEYIENIVGTIQSGVIAVAADGSITLFNAAAERMTRLRANAAKGSPLQILPASLAQALSATTSDRQPRTQIETAIHDESGRPLPIICSSSNLIDRSGAPLGAVVVFSDLTRIKELEQEKRRAERLASIGALASGIAHEIKNPLVAIKTFAELLPERFTDEDFHGEFSKVVAREIDRIDDLVARLRGLATHPVQRLVSLNLQEPLQETVSLLRAQLEQAHAAVHVLSDPALPPIAGDPAQLKQLFLNVLVNALEAMNGGGQLAVRLTTRDSDHGALVVAEVEDNGQGIPDEMLTKIFDPFVTTKPRGSGLGLSICRGIADAHHATIYARNNAPGPGATVVVEFPSLHNESSPSIGYEFSNGSALSSPTDTPAPQKF